MYAGVEAAKVLVVIALGERLRLDEDESEQSDQFWTHPGAHHITPFMPLNPVLTQSFFLPLEPCWPQLQW
jgi:hypothetical protein